MRVRIREDRTLVPLGGQLVYNSEDNAFDIELSDRRQAAERIGQSGQTSLVVGTLQVEVAVEFGNLLFVWGYCPRPSWKEGHLPLVNARPGGLKVDVKVDVMDDIVPSLESGISIGLVEVNKWPIVYDRQTGWLYIGDPNLVESLDCIEFAAQTIAVINEDHLTALWLQPVIR